MWANAQHDGCSAKYRWHPLFNAAVWLTPTTRAKTRKLLKFAGVPQTCQRISAVSRPKFTILWRHVHEVSMFNNFFRIVDTCLRCEDTGQQSCAMMSKWRFFCVLASRVQHISDMHFKFVLRPHHVRKYGRHPITDR